jgi:U3 small nucleolar RNA-associated protein 18
VDEGSASSSRPQGIFTPDFSEDFSNDIPGEEDEDELASDADASPDPSSCSDSEPDRNPFNAPSDPSPSAPSWSTSAKQKGKAPAWHDPSDATLTVSLAPARLRKLRDAPDDDAVSGREYERRLRRQYERIHGAADWADKARKKLRAAKRPRSRSPGSAGDSGLDDEAEEGAGVDGGLQELLASTGGLLSRQKTRTISSGVLSIERLRDANVSAKAEGAVKCVQFHPSPRVPVLLVGSTDRRLRLFNVSLVSTCTARKQRDNRLQPAPKSRSTATPIRT